MIFLRSVYCKAPRENFPPPFAGFCMPFTRHVETSRAKQKPAHGEAAKNRDFIDFIPRILDLQTTIFNISRKPRSLSPALQLDSTERGIALRSTHSLLYIFPKTPQLSHQTRLLLFITPLVSPFSYARVRALSEFAFFAFTLHLGPQPTEKQILAVKISVKFCLHRDKNRIQRSKTISAMNSDIFKHRRCILQVVKANPRLAFTFISLTNRNLNLPGEDVKAKIENSWTRVRARFGGKDMILPTKRRERRKKTPHHFGRYRHKTSI